ncbi:MAG: hypothetical protein LBP98_01425 [Tannerella sp.]|jgi:hypothetical protein|nr:hypothetical protein [Tannerella sp.]
MWKRVYYRLIKYIDWLWKGSPTRSSMAECLVPAAAEECVTSHGNSAFCGTKPGQTGQSFRTETNAGSSTPVESLHPAIQNNVAEHYTALLGAFPSREELQASGPEEPECDPDAMSESE